MKLTKAQADRLVKIAQEMLKKAQPKLPNAFKENAKITRPLKREIKAEYDPIRIATKEVRDSANPLVHPNYPKYKAYLSPGITTDKKGVKSTRYKVDYTKIAMDVAKKKFEQDPSRFIPEVTLNNAKTEKHGIAMFDLPAIKTCPGADQCKDICYADSGQIRNTGKLIKHAINYYSIKRPEFVDHMDKIIKHLSVHKNNKADGQDWGKYFRQHGYGDFFSPEYIAKWGEIMKRNPQMGRFYAYTKSYTVPAMRDALWNLSDNLPNFTLRQSLGARQNRFLDPNRPMALICEDNNDQVKNGERAGMVHCWDDDRLAAEKKNHIILLSAHGALSKRHDLAKHLQGLPPELYNTIMNTLKPKHIEKSELPAQADDKIDIADHYTQPDEAHTEEHELKHAFHRHLRTHLRKIK